jgi:hypothetical protein
MRFLYYFCFFGTMVSCANSEYDLFSKSKEVFYTERPNIAEKAPDIEVDPISVELGLINVIEEEKYTKTITIKNVGGAKLNILNIFLEDDLGSFSLRRADSRSLNPTKAFRFDIEFHPNEDGVKSDLIIIESNDPDEPRVEIPIIGEGLAPKIEVEPVLHDFGSPIVGCPEDLLIIIRNIGSINLDVSRITFSGVADTLFDIDEKLFGGAPWKLSPGEEIHGYVTYEAYDEIYDISYLTVESNDPQNQIVIATQIGDASRAGTWTDYFIQEDTEMLDILFVIDNSGSMNDEQTDLSTNAITFITTLDAGGAEYRIAVITTDNPIFRGPVLSSGYPDLVTEFENQLVAGVTGSAFETGLQMAYDSTLPGGDAAPGGIFQRSDAVLSIVFVSDEDDWSYYDVSSYYVAHFQSLKSTSDKVLLHAVADSPSDSLSCGSSGIRYEEAVNLTGGVFSSICTGAWATDLANIANGSLMANLDFKLAKDPIPETIVVDINGIHTVNGWSYDEPSNSVIFESDLAPIKDDLVEITYGHFSDCPQ